MTRRFLRFERGSVALESAFALSVIVIAFAGLMHIVGDVFAEDISNRGARAVARALALDPAADPWAALRREVDLDATCLWTAGDTNAQCDGWKLAIHLGVSPATLGAAALGVGDTAAGEMVLVRLESTASNGATTFGRGPPREPRS